MKNQQALQVGVIAVAGLMMLGVVEFSSSKTATLQPASQSGLPKDGVENEREFLETSQQPLPSTVAHAAEGIAVNATLTPFLRDIGSALNAIETELDDNRREQLLSNLIDWLAKGDVHAVLEFLNSNNSKADVLEVETRLLQKWAKEDPRTAAIAALGLGGANQQTILDAVLTVWANEQPDEAIAWVEDLPKGLQQGAQICVAYEVAREKPEEALGLVVAMPPSPERDDLLSYAVAQWAANSPQDTADWATQIKDKALRERIVSITATAWGDADPIDASNFALQFLPAGRAQDDALTGIVQRWTQTDPQAAAAWVKIFPQGDLRNAAVENVTALWAQSDPTKVAAWLNQLPQDTSRDAGVNTYASILAVSNPDVARQWAETVQDNAARAILMKRLDAP